MFFLFMWVEIIRAYVSLILFKFLLGLLETVALFN